MVAGAADADSHRASAQSRRLLDVGTGRHTVPSLSLPAAALCDRRRDRMDGGELDVARAQLRYRRGRQWLAEHDHRWTSRHRRLGGVLVDLWRVVAILERLVPLAIA